MMPEDEASYAGQAPLEVEVVLQAHLLHRGPVQEKAQLLRCARVQAPGYGLPVHAYGRAMGHGDFVHLDYRSDAVRESWQ